MSPSQKKIRESACGSMAFCFFFLLLMGCCLCLDRWQLLMLSRGVRIMDITTSRAMFTAFSCVDLRLLLFLCIIARKVVTSIIPIDFLVLCSMLNVNKYETFWQSMSFGVIVRYNSGIFWFCSFSGILQLRGQWICNCPSFMAVRVAFQAYLS